LPSSPRRICASSSYIYSKPVKRNLRLPNQQFGQPLHHVLRLGEALLPARGYLKTLHVDYLKIDGQFIKDVVIDPLDAATVRFFVHVARVVGVQTVSEFVDKAEVLERLTAIGVDDVQGYLLHEPEPQEGLLLATFNLAMHSTLEGLLYVR